jgi:uncharacterized protein HemX
MTTLAILVVVGISYACFYFGWKQGSHLGEKRAWEKVKHRVDNAEKRAHEHIKRREDAEYKFNNEKIRADSWERVAKKESLEKEKKKADEQQKAWFKFLQERQAQYPPPHYWHPQMMGMYGQAQQPYSGFFPFNMFGG